jgi:flavodoxin I
MEKVVIIYGSTTGNTETAAETIKQKIGTDNTDVINAADASETDLNDYQNIILGSSTWGAGDLQDDFEEFLETLEAADLTNKTIAIFGYGDQDSYSDTFVDGLGTIYNSIKDKSCNIVGFTCTDGYDFSDSTAIVDNKFVGLVLDEENQSDLTDERIDRWVLNLKDKLN